MFVNQGMSLYLAKDMQAIPTDHMHAGNRRACVRHRLGLHVAKKKPAKLTSIHRTYIFIHTLIYRCGAAVDDVSGIRESAT